MGRNLGRHVVTRLFLGAVVLSMLTGLLAQPTGAQASSSPIGSLDKVTINRNGVAWLSGWALDPDTQKPVQIRAVVDNNPKGKAAKANLVREDVGRLYPGAGDKHGFVASAKLSGWGTTRVCAEAADRKGKNPPTIIGCKLVHNVERSKEWKKGRIVIQGTGDVRADPWWYQTNGGAPDYSQAFAGLDGLFNDDDLTVINLECTASRLGRAVPKNFNFRCDPDAFQPFLDAGVDVASQGNNHALDYGVTGLLDGIEQMWDAGLPEVGAGNNAADANQPVYLAINGWRVAVLGFAGFVEARHQWWLADNNRAGLANGYDIPAMEAAVTAAKENADLVVVSIHWGREGVTVHNQSQTDRGRAMIDAGADIVFGHHPHRIQPVEAYADGVIFYSLGNFVWPKLSAASADTGVARVEIRANGKKKFCLLPATITSSGRPTLDTPTKRTC